MKTPTAIEIEAWLAGAMEPGHALEIAEAVAADPTLLPEERLKGRSADGDRPADQNASEPARRWRIPPPGLFDPRRPFRAETQAAPAMGGETLRPGQRFRVRIDGPNAAEGVMVVVLHRGASGWRVLFPRVPEERISLAELRVEDDGARYLDLVAREEPGLQRFALAFPPADLATDWTEREEDRWRRLEDAIAEGRVPAQSVEVSVAP